jgi:hypothetical protein
MISESLPSTPRGVGLTGCMNRGGQAPIPFRSGGYATRRPVPVVGDGWRGWRRWDIGFFWKLNLGRISIFVACHLLVLLVPRRAFLNGEICYSNTLFKMQEFLCRTLNFFGAAWVSLQFLVKWKKVYATNNVSLCVVMTRRLSLHGKRKKQFKNAQTKCFPHMSGCTGKTF